MKFVLLAAFLALATAKSIDYGVSRMSTLYDIPIHELGRIVGGFDAVDNSSPWQVSLQFNISGARYHFCGGSLISTTVVITAAHCLDSLEYPVVVALGDHILNAGEGTEQFISASNTVMHPQYRPNSPGIPSDIGYIVLSKPAVLNNVTQPIPYAAPGDVFDGTDECYITGWGRTSGTDSQSAAMTLQQSDMTIVSQQSCANTWGATYIKDSHVCIDNFQSSACMGDSGGPLVCKNSDGSQVLVGLTSWGSSTCRLDLPNIYTKMSAFSDWVDAALNNLG